MTIPAVVVRSGDDPSSARIESLLDSALPQAYPLALCLTGTHAAASRLIEAAAIEAARSLRTLDPHGRQTIWFLRIVTNHFRRLARQRRPSSHRSLDTVCDLFLYTELGAANATVKESRERAQAFVQGFDSDRFLAALQILPRESRLLAALSFANELSYDDLSFVLTYPIGAVRSKLRQSRKLLQVAMWRLQEEEGTPPEATR